MKQCRKLKTDATDLLPDSSEPYTKKKKEVLSWFSNNFPFTEGSREGIEDDNKTNIAWDLEVLQVQYKLPVTWFSFPNDIFPCSLFLTNHGLKTFLLNRDGGMKGLFMGVAPRVGRAGPSVGIVVSSYEVVKYFLYYRRLTEWLKVTHSLIVIAVWLAFGYWFYLYKADRVFSIDTYIESGEITEYAISWVNQRVPVMMVDKGNKCDRRLQQFWENKRSSSLFLGMPGFKVFPSKLSRFFRL